MKESYRYTNDLGRVKEIHLTEKENSTYTVTLWDIATGEMCGCGTMTTTEITEYLMHYNVEL